MHFLRYTTRSGSAFAGVRLCKPLVIDGLGTDPSLTPSRARERIDGMLGDFAKICYLWWWEICDRLMPQWVFRWVDRPVGFFGERAGARR